MDSYLHTLEFKMATCWMHDSCNGFLLTPSNHWTPMRLVIRWTQKEKISTKAEEHSHRVATYMFPSIGIGIKGYYWHTKWSLCSASCNY